MPGLVSDDKSESSDARGKKAAQYKVFWNKPQQKRVLILQFPNRKHNDALTAEFHSKPLELRIKPSSGLVEIDVPIQIDKCYNKVKGVQFGRALKHSRTLQNNGEYGIAGGFGAQVQPRPGREVGRSTHTEDTEDFIVDNFEEARRQGLAMSKITLGGRLRAFRTGDPMYAIGAFHGDELHLTKVDAICSLQPQFHHLDAIADNERISNRATGPADHTESEARAVNLAVKSADDEELDMSEVGKTLKAMQEESWQRLNWIDENDERSYITYANDLMLTSNTKSKRLVSSMTEKQYLDAISAPRIDPIYQGQRVMLSRPWSSESDEDPESTDEEDDVTNVPKQEPNNNH